MELTNWKTAYKIESFGKKNFGIEVRVAVDRPLNENDNMAMYSIADQIEKAILSESMRLDPEEQEAKDDEYRKLVNCFGGVGIFTEPIPNGYCNRWCCTQKPWYRVTTPRGVVTIGWRKRVIHLEWEPRVSGGVKADDLFPAEAKAGITTGDFYIHAYGYEKATEHLKVLLQDHHDL